MHFLQGRWPISTRSNGSGCVEARYDGGSLRVRDFEARASTELVFTPGEWAAFVAGVRDGDFDLDPARPEFA
jgi:hypothetical protein